MSTNYTSTKPDVKSSWQTLVKLEPRLGALERDIKRVKDDPNSPGFCANYHWYQTFKPRLIYLAGFSAEKRDQVLKSCAAYDVAYHHLYELLPDCRSCNCFPSFDFWLRAVSRKRQRGNSHRPGSSVRR